MARTCEPSWGAAAVAWERVYWHLARALCAEPAWLDGLGDLLVTVSERPVLLLPFTDEKTASTLPSPFNLSGGGPEVPPLYKMG